MTDKYLPSDFKDYSNLITVHSRLSCSIEPEINPHEEQVAQICLDKAYDMDIVHPLTKEEAKSHWISRVAARTYPKANKEQLEIALDFLYFLFFFDDQSETSANRLLIEAERRAGEDRIVEIAFGGIVENNDNNFAICLASIMERCREIAHPTWMDRFALHLKHYVDGIRWERQIRFHNHKSSLSTYVKLRSIIAGVQPCLDLAGIFHCVAESKHVDDGVYIRQLELMACNHIAWTNDIVSIPKDLSTGAVENLVEVLVNERNIHRPQALDTVVNMCNSELDAFIELEEKMGELCGTLDEDTKTYIQGMKNWIRGNMDWSVETGRYKGDSTLSHGSFSH